MVHFSDLDLQSYKIWSGSLIHEISRAQLKVIKVSSSIYSTVVMHGAWIFAFAYTYPSSFAAELGGRGSNDLSCLSMAQSVVFACREKLER